MKVFILTKKKLAVLAASLAVLMCFGAVGAHRGGLAVETNAGARKIPIYCVQTEKKQVALSFDAAWGNEQTQTLIDILAKNDVHSTFFLVGDWVRNYPDDVKKIYDAGHDVGNHSNTHPYMTQLDGDSIKNEINTCNKDIENIIGKKPTLFRPPYGDYDNNVVDTVNSMGMYCIQWSIDSLDWQDPSPDEILARIKDNLAPGAIILMHNGAKNTPEALPRVIEYIKSQDYEIVPISQLLPKGKYTTDVNGMMIPSESDSVKTSAEMESMTSRSTASASPARSASSAAISSLPPTSSDMSSTTSRSVVSVIPKSSDTASKKTSSYSGLAGELYNNTQSRKMKK
ncbi:MAG: polysaccharide deacetylase family protein [Clostridia bacterium]|nr:polysaccharide deacetylase family protein [Clostridia bacterium]